MAGQRFLPGDAVLRFTKLLVSKIAHYIIYRKLEKVKKKYETEAIFFTKKFIFPYFFSFFSSLNRKSEKTNLFYAKKFDFLPHGTNAKGDACGIGRI